VRNVPECLKCGKYFNLAENIVEEIRPTAGRGKSWMPLAIVVRCPHCGFKYVTPIKLEAPQKKIEIGCYKAKIEKFADDLYKIYLFQSLEEGGDTEILVSGQIEVWREAVEKDEKGRLWSSGFRRIEF